MSDPIVMISPQGVRGRDGIVGDLGWNTGQAALISGEMLGGFVIAKAFVLSAANSFAYAHTPATAEAVFLIFSEVAGVSTQIGTVTFAPGSYVGVVTLSATAAAQGAWINIVAPNPADATLALVAITLASL